MSTNIAKKRKNTFEMFTKQIKIDYLNKLTMVNDIKDGIERDEFVLYYQPQIDSRTNKLVGLEALVRWNHPEKGLLFPNEFIEIALHNGLLTKLDRYLIKKTIKFLPLTLIILIYMKM